MKFLWNSYRFILFYFSFKNFDFLDNSLYLMFFNYPSESLFHLQASVLFPPTKRPLPRSLFALFLSL